ncbi:MAG: sensor histidine kinase [Actinomycetota bacterium]
MDGPTFWERLRRVDPLIWDSLLAAVIAIGSMVGAVIGEHASSDPARGPSGPEAYVLLVGGSAVLAVRRRWPIAVLVAVSGASIALASVNGAFDLVFPVVLATYTAAAHVDRERFVRLSLPISIVGTVAALVVAYPGTNWVEALISATFAAGLPMLLGRIGFNRRRRIDVDRERAAYDAVAEERARIARELHDVVAHAMSVMVVQAGAARSVLDDDPASARAAIGRIESTGRDGLTEMRRLIGILKADGADADRAPQPGLGQLDALLETVRGAGVPVEAVTEGAPSPLPTGLDLVAYRIVQEALTNVIKHAGPAHARVLLRWGDAALDVEVADDGRGLIASTDGGLGLVGMRERVALYGGSIRTEPRSGGGFVVHAHLPLEEGSTP